MNEIHIGNLIRTELKSKGIQMQWFCKQLHVHCNTAYGILQRAWVDTHTLMKISLILHHNFFTELSEEARKLMENNNSSE